VAGKSLSLLCLRAFKFRTRTQARLPCRTHDFGSILKFIEGVFNLPTIDPNVTIGSSTGFADSRSDDLSDCFDFTQTPIVFQPIQSQYDASHFLNDRRPPVDPDDD
jgi:hypothetical protein